MNTLKTVKDFLSRYGKLYMKVPKVGLDSGYYIVPSRRPSGVIASLDSELAKYLGWKPFSGKTLTVYTDSSMCYGKNCIVVPIRPYRMILPKKGSYIITGQMVRSFSKVSDLAYAVYNNLVFNLVKKSQKKEVVISANRCYIIVGSEKLVDDLFI